MRRTRRLLVLGAVLAAGLAATGPVRPTTAAPGDVTAFSTLPDIKYPAGMALAPDGNLWITSGSSDSGHLTRLAPDGTLTPFRGTRLSYPGQIVTGLDGHLWSTTATGIGRTDPADGTTTVFSDGLDGHAEHLVPTTDAVWFTATDGRLGRIAPDGTITTYALPGTCCDPAGDLTVASDGSLWFTLPSHGLVVRSTPAGALTPFAAGPDPTGIAAGPAGDVWFTGRRAVGHITAAGHVERFPHDLVTPSDDLVLAADGNLWFTSPGTSRFGRVTPAGAIRLFWHGSAASATDLTATPSGEVWYVAPDRDVVGRIRPDGTIRTFGGSGVSAPGFLVAGPDDDLWFGASRTAVGSITPTGDIDLHGGTANTSAPDSIAVGPDGNVWFTAPRVETDDPVGRVTPTGDVATYDEEPVCRTTEPCFHIWGGQDLVAGPDGNLWFVDTEGQIVRSTPDGDLAVWAAPGYPMGSITIGHDGALWIGGSVGGRTGGRIFRLAPASGRLRAFADPQLGRETRDLVTGPDGRVWFISGRHRIGRITTTGTIRTFGSAEVRDVEDLVLGADGALWFSSHRRINRISTSGQIRTFSHPAVGQALALTAGPDGNIWFVTPVAGRVGRISPSGQFTLLRHPDVAVLEWRVDMVAVDDGVWLTSTGTDRVAHVTVAGDVTTVPVGPIARGLVVGDDGDLWVGTVGGLTRVELD